MEEGINNLIGCYSRMSNNFFGFYERKSKPVGWFRITHDTKYKLTYKNLHQRLSSDPSLPLHGEEYSHFYQILLITF